MSEIERAAGSDVVPPDPPDAPPVRMVDWSLAARGVKAVTPPGPKIGADEAHAVVAELREASQRAYQPVADTSGLHTATGPEPALVVDRPTWAQINITSFAALLDPIVAKLAHRPGKPLPGPIAQRIGGAATGGEVAALLAFMSTKVLGQYDLAYAPGTAPRLLLVAPNVVQVERELDLVPADFRLWVCLHEETHRVQFTAVPWLREHMLGRTRRVATDLVPDADQLLDRLKLAARNAPEVLRPGGTGLPELFLDADQRAELASIGAVMALLEGHADVVMDEVGPQVVPSVAAIRARFDKRRQGISGLDILIRRLLGLEAKMAQYRDGAAFVRAVTARVGRDDFNAVWTSPQTLPSAAEIQEPDRWIARVHG
ncbi:MAG: zinc-dependent metalloprotease [Austwickia sp.]|nr:zinc-dependent metalloprotease [Actinomycetota bacterium]MCO5310403.1 zinc-dependent metalloprotease [Austwickia sp.]